MAHSRRPVLVLVPVILVLVLVLVREVGFGDTVGPKAFLQLGQRDRGLRALRCVAVSSGI